MNYHTVPDVNIFSVVALSEQHLDSIKLVETMEAVTLSSPVSTSGTETVHMCFGEFGGICSAQSDLSLDIVYSA